MKDLYQFVSIQNQYAVVDFPASCTNSPFYFSMTFPYQPTQIIWDFNGLFPNVTINNPVFDSTWFVNGRQLYRYKLPDPYTITAVGTYPIKVTAQNPTSDGCGNLQEIDYDLQVFSPPAADFIFNDNGCVNSAVSFSDNSNTGGRPVISRHWDFGDAATSSSNNPAHTYTAPGSYPVKYSLITDVGCLSDTATHVVQVSNLPIALFGVSSPECQGKTITFTDMSTLTGGGSIVKWYWDFGDGTLDTAFTNAAQTHTYTATGIYTVTLKAETTTGCQSTVYSIQVTVSPNPVPGFTFPNFCLPGAGQFSNTSAISDGTQTSFTYNWSFGDGSPNVTTQNPSHIFPGVGPYIVTLTVTSNNGCIDSSVQSVNTIYAQADGGFTMAAENCLNDVTSFTSTSNALPGNTIAEWHWDFGDALGSTSQNPAHTYAAAGTYTVKHWIVTDKGCNSDTAIQTVTINPLPAADYTFGTPACETKTISFTDLSIANAGALNSWTWNFGDGSPIETIQNPVHTFSAAGAYPVTLIVTSTKGCVSSVFNRQVIIHPQPKPGFILPEVCLTDAFAQFIDTTGISSGSISSWQWNFGDPGSGPLNTSTLQSPQHAYSAVGTYTASLIVTSNNGCVDSLVQSFTVNGDIPVANFNAINPASLCANDSVAIQDGSTVNFGNITRVEIYWDNAGAPAVFETDDLPFPGKVYKHLYPNFQSPLTKTYTIRYRAYSGATCVNDRIKAIVINAAPEVQFNNIPDICLDAAPYQITQASEVGGVPGKGVYTGPGVTTSGIFTPSSVGPGVYAIKYTFTSTAGGCIDTITKTIKVLEPPVPDFSFAGPACETQAVTFSDNSYTVEGVLTTWTWDFADGSPLVIRNTPNSFTHTFAASGTYAVKLSVTTSNGCVSIQKVIPVTVNPLPRPNFSIPASACLPDANVTFKDLSAIADGTQSSFTYLWNFGDPGSGGVNTSTGANPSHVYVTTGPFNISLQVTSGAGCKHDTTIVLNTIHPQPLASFTTDKPEECVGGSFIFTDNSDPLDGTTTQWNWVMDDGNTKNAPVFTYTYADARTYNVSLFIFNSHGCRSTTSTKPVTVHPYPVVNAGPDRFVLEGGTITLEPVVTGNDLSYTWTPDLYFAGSNAVKNPIVNGVNDQNYLLTVTARGGCAASDQVFIKVLRKPVIPNIFSPNGDGINDRWVIDYLDSYPGCVVQIYNRYGQMVQRYINYTNPWDGKINGRDAPVGTYYYVIEPKNGRPPITGFVDIIR